jgi:hypothetical protein
LIFRKNELIFHKNELSFRKNGLIFRNYELIFRKNELYPGGKKCGKCHLRDSVSKRLPNITIHYSVAMLYYSSLQAHFLSTI